MNLFSQGKAKLKRNSNFLMQESVDIFRNASTYEDVASSIFNFSISLLFLSTEFSANNCLPFCKKLIVFHDYQFRGFTFSFRPVFIYYSLHILLLIKGSKYNPLRYIEENTKFKLKVHIIAACSIGVGGKLSPLQCPEFRLAADNIANAHREAPATIQKLLILSESQLGGIKFKPMSI